MFVKENPDRKKINITFYCHILNSADVKNVIHQRDKNEWLVLSASQQGFQQNLSCLRVNTGKRFFLMVF